MRRLLLCAVASLAVALRDYDVLNADGDWADSEPVGGAAVFGVPPVIHRSHRYTRAALEAEDCAGGCAMTLQNLRSCASNNARHQTRCTSAQGSATLSRS
ncbi:hypothetical protein M885DRAFT_552932 [Pelagophyceae sp. CCMP2097]|nr:hypothetical protein M885DRAFT_552932 [Pelagophyceae sp. CCMP2097]